MQVSEYFGSTHHVSNRYDEFLDLLEYSLDLKGYQCVHVAESIVC